MWGYGDLPSRTASRSKKRERGMRRARKEEAPVREYGSFGRNHAALTGRMRGGGGGFADVGDDDGDDDDN